MNHLGIIADVRDAHCASKGLISKQFLWAFPCVRRAISDVFVWCTGVCYWEALKCFLDNVIRPDTPTSFWTTSNNDFCA